jgi:molybdate transport system substrate-binding protein
MRPAQTCSTLSKSFPWGLLLGAFLGLAPGVLQADATVFAAASLKDALDELASAYRKRVSGRIIVSYAASSALAQQIAQGAPADIFISADLEWMEHLDKLKLIRKGSRVTLLSNRLVLVAPADSKAAFTIGPRFPLAKLLGDRRLAMADPDYVPAGRYGRAALESLGVWTEVSARIARAENVRAALAFVARGEAPFGIVYRTDAMAEGKVRIVGEFAASLHPRIIYPAAVLVRSKSPAAEAFLGYLRSPQARPMWERHGFGVVDR